VIAANTQWHDPELVLKMAVHSYDRELVAGDEDTCSLAMMHAYHVHEALQEASRAITMLIKNVPCRGHRADHHSGACHRHPPPSAGALSLQYVERVLRIEPHGRLARLRPTRGQRPRTCGKSATGGGLRGLIVSTPTARRA
jgi:hypothetical protein